MKNNDIDTQLDRRRSIRELEKQFVIEERREFEQHLAKARQRAGTDQELLELVTWIDILSQLGAHPTYIIQAWSGWRSRRSYTMDLTP